MGLLNFIHPDGFLLRCHKKKITFICGFLTANILSVSSILSREKYIVYIALNFKNFPKQEERVKIIIIMK